MTSVLPRTCTVGVEYEGRKSVSLSEPEGLNPATEIQNVLGSREPEM